MIEQPFEFVKAYVSLYRGAMSRRRSSRAPLTPAVPSEPQPVQTGIVELVPDPGSPRSFTLMIDGVPSSHIDLDDPTYLEFEYMLKMATVIDRTGEPGSPLDVVHLGAAGCSLARYVHATRPGSRQLAVEIDPVLAEKVRTWFELPRSPALRIRVGDAREVLESLPDASADLVIRDVFADARTPDHVQTVEFTEQVARVLRPGGRYLANCADRPPLRLARAEGATVASVFPAVALIAEPALLRGRRYGNIVIVGTHDKKVVTDPRLARAILSLPVPSRILHGSELTRLVGGAPPLRDPEGPPLEPPMAG